MNKTRVKSTLAQATIVVSMLSGVALTLQGCALAVVGAVGAGTLVATDRRTLGAQTEDREIQVKASSRIGENLPDTAHVNVTVFNRRVLLTGEVPDDASKQKAEAVVRDINNVASIVNELAIQGASSFSSRANDSYLEGRVKTAMVGKSNLRANYYKVVCERGIVYLMGLVTQDEGSHGADVAAQTPGVEQVVKVFQYIKPEEATALEAAVASDASAVSAASAPAAAEPTVGAIPDSSVTSRPLDKQAPAPVKDSNVHSGNPNPSSTAK
ncbi:21 kDa hemolysin precursor [Candidatus Burkholderia verschuerenii]|uniref:21 kDa hemolysin n=1 Tax=Candidatus Burkholderia verschuerenii TaxID=242163 RepID=A0A0L0M466_9BURK|nr:BON domain-containing protein [Candidatus Burkholderia verschuerenii]KND57163.1 21 kDa hemolysin precursor [Candidatus Burkholderia verschuerenii]